MRDHYIYSPTSEIVYIQNYFTKTIHGTTRGIATKSKMIKVPIIYNIIINDALEAMSIRCATLNNNRLHIYGTSDEYIHMTIVVTDKEIKISKASPLSYKLDKYVNETIPLLEYTNL
jgi:hypothetical protein